MRQEGWGGREVWKEGEGTTGMRQEGWGGRVVW